MNAGAMLTFLPYQGFSPGCRLYEPEAGLVIVMALQTGEAPTFGQGLHCNEKEGL